MRHGFIQQRHIVDMLRQAQVLRIAPLSHRSSFSVSSDFPDDRAERPVIITIIPGSIAPCAHLHEERQRDDYEKQVPHRPVQGKARRRHSCSSAVVGVGRGVILREDKIFSWLLLGHYEHNEKNLFCPP